MTIAVLVAAQNELLGKGDGKHISYISSVLFKQNLQIHSYTAVQPIAENVFSALNTLVGTSDIVFILAEEVFEADIKEGVCRLLGDTLIDNSFAKKAVLDFFKTHNLPATKASLKHSLLPSGAKAVVNKLATLAGFITEYDGKKIFFLPYDYAQMKNMFETAILPFLAEETKKSYFSIKVNTYGLPENKVIELLMPVIKNKHKIAVAVKEQDGQVDVILRYSDKSSKVAVDETTQFIYDKLEKFIIGDDHYTLSQIAAHFLEQKNKTVSFVECGTDGILSEIFLHENKKTKSFLEGDIFGLSEYKNEAFIIDKTVLQKPHIGADMAFELAASGLEHTGASIVIASLCVFDGSDYYTGLQAYVAIGDSEHIDIYQNTFLGSEAEIKRKIAGFAFYNLVKKLKK